MISRATLLGNAESTTRYDFILEAVSNLVSMSCFLMLPAMIYRWCLEYEITLRSGCQDAMVSLL